MKNMPYCCICGDHVPADSLHDTGFPNAWEQYSCRTHTEAETATHVNGLDAGYCSICGAESGHCEHTFPGYG